MNVERIVNIPAIWGIPNIPITPNLLTYEDYSEQFQNLQRLRKMKTVLVVEDSHAEQQLISNLLSRAGFDVEVKGDAESAWEWLQSHPLPNLIVLDIIMPGQSGLDLCRSIREEAKFANVPILFCSSKDQEFDKFWALRQGGNEYVTKPFAPKDLLDRVYQHVN
jgi:twitching motility two-component system response regulator PilH